MTPRSGVLALAACTTLGVPGRVDAQRCRSGAQPLRVAAVAGGFGVAEAVVLFARHDDWWTSPQTSFHFRTGGSASRGQDLLLHGAIAYHTAQLAIHAWEWTCVSRGAAAWLGAGLGLAVGLPKEIGDGLREGKGFALDDMGVSALAAVLPALHHTVPDSRVLALKVNYWPSFEYRNRPDGLPQIENDYAGQRFYLTLSPGRAPGGAGPWPDWLGLGLGHSVPSWATIPPEHEWYVALDLNLRGLPINTGWWHRLATVLDQIHFPLPGVRVRGGAIALGLY